MGHARVLLTASDGRGFARLPGGDVTLLDVYAAYDRDTGAEEASAASLVVFKTGVLLTTLFLFFTTSTLVSFTLRETQQ